MALNDLGKITYDEWLQILIRYPRISSDTDTDKKHENCMISE
jgi:hypothetical protein